MVQQRPATRIEEITLLRGLAILAVVAIHTSAHFVSVQGVNGVVAVSILIDVFSHFAVPLFILLSGLALSLRYGVIDSMSKFYARRARSILPPYVLFSLFFILFSLVRGISMTWGEVLFSLATASSAYHLWFVAVIVQLYILYPLLIKTYNGFSNKNRVVVFLVALLFAQFAWGIAKSLLLDHLLVGSSALTGTFQILVERVFASHLFYFGVGIWIGQNLESTTRFLLNVNVFGLVIVSALLTVGISLLWVAGIYQYGHFSQVPQRHFWIATILDPALYLALSALLFRMLPRIKDVPRVILHALGESSLGVYLVHTFYILVAVSLLRRVSIKSADWLFYPVTFLLAVSASYFTVKMVSYLPGGSVMVGLGKRS